MVKIKMDPCEIVPNVIAALFVFFFFVGIIITLGQSLVDVRLNQETADDVCRQLTGNSTAIASDDYIDGFSGGKLICTIPSYDSTQNIIIKGNNK